MIRKIILTLVLTFVLIACSKSGSSNPKVESSGHADLDQTAKYALFTINKVKKRSGMDSPSKVLEYMLSIQGSAELTPPNPDTEPGIADTYRGPRPANGVGLYGRRMEVLEKEIILEPKDDKNIIIAKAFENETGDLLHTWEWKF